MAVAYNQFSFRVRTDATAAQGGTPVWGAAQSTNFNIAVDTPFRIRFCFESTGSSGTAAASIQSIFYSLNSGAYAQVPSTSTGNPVFSTDAAGGHSSDNSAITTSLLTGAAGTFLTTGEYDDSGATASITVTRGDYIECEFGLQFNSLHLHNGDVITFRSYRNTTAMTTYTVTPSFTISGIVSSSFVVPINLVLWT